FMTYIKLHVRYVNVVHVVVLLLLHSSVCVCVWGCVFSRANKGARDADARAKKVSILARLSASFCAERRLLLAQICGHCGLVTDASFKSSQVWSHNPGWHKETGA